CDAAIWLEQGAAGALACLYACARRWPTQPASPWLPACPTAANLLPSRSRRTAPASPAACSAAFSLAYGRLIARPLCRPGRHPPPCQPRHRCMLIDEHQLAMFAPRLHKLTHAEQRYGERNQQRRDRGDGRIDLVSQRVEHALGQSRFVTSRDEQR